MRLGAERVLGQDHPDTLTSRNNLALAYQDAGRAAEAIPPFEQTLADRQRVLGQDHPHTLTSRNNAPSGRFDDQIRWPMAVGCVLRLRGWLSRRRAGSSYICVAP